MQMWEKYFSGRAQFIILSKEKQNKNGCSTVQATESNGMLWFVVERSTSVR